MDDFDLSFKVYYDLMKKRVSEILLVSSLYDAFIMEEDEPLTERIIHEYRGLNLSRPPRLTYVPNAEKAFEALSKRNFDLVLTMPRQDDIEPSVFGAKIKEKYKNLPVVVLTHTLTDSLMERYSEMPGIDRVFVWSGNTHLLLAIVKNLEDCMNVDNDTQRAMVRVIIFVEDSPVYRSSILPLLYQEVVGQTNAVMEDSLNEEHRIVRMRARPKILVAETYEDAEDMYRQFKPYILSVFSDVRFPKDGVMDSEAGFSLLSMIHKESPDIPLLLLSSEEKNREKALSVPAMFLNKTSVLLHQEIHSFLSHYLGFGNFVFRIPGCGSEEGCEVARAANLLEMEKILPNVPDESILYHGTRNHFSTWLMARSEIQLALKLRPIKASNFASPKEIKEFLISCIRDRRKHRQRGIISDFSSGTFDTEADFIKVGRGSLGGKARGLAFMSALLRRKKSLPEQFPNILIFIPKTLVLSTECFDVFLDKNRLRDAMTCECDDHRITELFEKAAFPERFRRDLESFLKQVSTPLAIRSSSLLEDAPYQPWAGIYNTFMIPNNHPDLSVRLEQLINAIKMVYASTFMELPKSFALRTAHRTEEEKMAVIIQQLVGMQYDNLFYPAISGVAQSYNFYPISYMKPEEGIVHLALGLGKTVVEGGSSLRFSPAYPQFLPQFSSVDDILKHSQRYFYALNLKADSTTPTDEATLIRADIEDVRDHFPVKILSGTYIHEEHRIRDSAMPTGQRVLTYANILKYDLMPLPQLIMTMLKIGSSAMGCPVEIEFAVNLYPDQHRNSEFALLQIRPMALSPQNMDIEISEEEIRHAWCFSDSALGNGRFEDVSDIVFVKPDNFDPSKTVDISDQISAINRKLVEEKRRYFLIGPGRWGSADRWLGIPVNWSDISGVGAIVETESDNLKADPSQGSHFFNNITSLSVSYLTVRGKGRSFINWDYLLSLPIHSETEYIRHARIDKAMILKADGKRSRAVMSEHAY